MAPARTDIADSPQGVSRGLRRSIVRTWVASPLPTSAAAAAAGATHSANAIILVVRQSSANARNAATAETVRPPRAWYSAALASVASSTRWKPLRCAVATACSGCCNARWTTDSPRRAALLSGSIAAALAKYSKASS